MKNIISKQILNKHDNTYATYSETAYDAATEENIFATFKTNPDYTYQLEHTSPKLGSNYIELLFKEHLDDLKMINWDDVRLNDQYGGTDKYSFGQLQPYCGNNCYFSPTTIGYLYLSLRMIRSLQQLKFEKVDVIEIGCGYGGQCLLFHLMARLYNLSINSYTLVDLKYPNLLQEKYLSKTIPENKRLRFLSCDQYETWKPQIKNVDFVISNYALSEMSDQWAER